MVCIITTHNHQQNSRDVIKAQRAQRYSGNTEGTERDREHRERQTEKLQQKFGRNYNQKFGSNHPKGKKLTEIFGGYKKS